MNSFITKLIAGNNQIKAAGIDGTVIVNEAVKRHKLAPVAAAALGRTMMGTLLMATNLKNYDCKLTVRVLGDGPLGGIIVTANGRYDVRGYVQEPHVNLPLSEKGKLDVGRAVGKKGFLYVTKDLLLKEPYTGTSKLASGEIGEDFANYLFYSEQTPSVVALGVLVNPDCSIQKAGGYLVQLLPNCAESVVKELEENVAAIEPISSLMQKGYSVNEVLEKFVLKGLSPVDLEEKQVHFACECSKQKLEKTLISLGAKELSDIIDEQGKAELICHFCNEKYTFSKEELLALIKEISQ